MTPPELRDTGVADVDTVARTITDAFVDDAITNWIFGRAAAKEAGMKVLLRRLYMTRGFVRQTPAGEGVALWMPPGGAGDASTLDLLRFAAAVAPRGGLKPLSRGTAVSDAFEALKTERPHLYLFTLAVAPSAQGRGLGSLLIKDGLRTADSAGVPTYLETSTPKNVELYQRHGFDVTSEAAPVPGAPTVWTMRRPVQA